VLEEKEGAREAKRATSARAREKEGAREAKRATSARAQGKRMSAGKIMDRARCHTLRRPRAQPIIHTEFS
jgi:hypothetical protein